jgi:hypothetical protein
MLSAGRTDIAACFRKPYFPPGAMVAGMPVSVRETSMGIGIRMERMHLPSRGISEEAACCGPVMLLLPVTVISTVTMTAMVPMPSYSKMILEEAHYEIPAPIA